MSLGLGIGSKAKQLLLSPMKSENSLGVADTPQGLDSGGKQVDFGSKEEIFFDSQGWLDSDCEDDFVSVNGDWTPLREITPTHQINKTPQMNKVFSADSFPDATTDPSSVDAKMKLSELLRENEAEHDAKQDEISTKPYFDEVDSRRTPSENLKHQKEKKMKINRCCLPRFSLRLKERRKQKMNPVH